MIDVQQFSERLGNNTAIVEQVMKMFRDQYGHQPDILRGPASAGNLEELFQIAHSIKGALANMCAADDAAVAAEIEHQARAGQNPDDALLADLEARIIQITQQIDEHCS